MNSLMRLLVIDELAEVEKVLGIVDKKDINNMISVAEQLDMKCLNFVDSIGDTYFNEKQVNEIKKEIVILQCYSPVSKKLLDMIEEGIKIAQREGAYLKFEDLANS